MNTGWMSPRVGVGFARMGRDLDAERRRGVAAFGFGLEGSSSVVGLAEVANGRIVKREAVIVVEPALWRLS